MSEVLARQQEVGFLRNQNKPQWGKFKQGVCLDLSAESGEGQMSIHGYFREGHVVKSF